MVVERKNGVQKKKTDKSGLGRAIINRRAKQAKIAADPTLHVAEISHGLSSITQENDLDEFLSTAALAETDFAAGERFHSHSLPRRAPAHTVLPTSAERQNIKVVSDPSIGAATHNPYLLTPQQEREMRKKQSDNAERLQVPRRPAWTRETKVIDLERTERDSFLAWRRGLADLQENQSLLLTPFERNLEVWRQLWRTVERSDLVVQIVDARNPLNFRSEDLERYVLELNDLLEESLESGKAEEEAPVAEASTSASAASTSKGKAKSGPKPKKQNLLLINKSDLLTQRQREKWADYFEERKIQYAFFSAANGIAIQEERARLAAIPLDGESESSSEEDEDSEEELDEEEMENARMKVPKSGNKLKALKVESDYDTEDDSEEEEDSDEELAGRMARGAGISTPGSDEPERTRILSVLELEALFLAHAPTVSIGAGHSTEKMTVGLVGYPNVGKSSTINALIGEKKVSVSSTPGKTKHFQTIRLSPDVLLCDCPGLVFPQFAATKADLVCDGVLPIDQMKEHTGPVALITKRIPQGVLEGMYGLRIVTVPVSEGGSGVPTATEFLTTYAIARGFFTGGMGNADTSRASRFVLKDYVNGKLLFCHPPPNVSADDFNSENRDLVRLRSLGVLREKKAPTTRVPIKADTYISQVGEEGAAGALSKTRQSHRARALDSNFFASPSMVGKAGVRGVAGGMNGSDFQRVKMFPHQKGFVGEDGVLVKGKKKIREAKKAAGVEVEGSDKKHFKPRRQKQRSGRGYE